MDIEDIVQRMSQNQAIFADHVFRTALQGPTLRLD